MQHLAVPTGGIVVDATVGLGGHSALLLDRIGPAGLLIGLDVDNTNLELARRRLEDRENFRLFHENFADLEQVLAAAGHPRVDAVLADLGLSSNQLQEPGRGFSFGQDGPLDMRMDPRLQTTAAELVNRLSETNLANLLYENGQERHSRRIARAVHQARRHGRITSTAQLADIVCSALRRPGAPRPPRIHPATKTFMALRIAVNRELESLELFLGTLPRVLKPGGRAGVISFHSLEDVRCKRAFRLMKQQGLALILTKKPVTPSAAERQDNPRSRSAKLRVLERTQRIE